MTSFLLYCKRLKKIKRSATFLGASNGWQKCTRLPSTKVSPLIKNIKTPALSQLPLPPYILFFVGNPPPLQFIYIKREYLQPPSPFIQLSLKSQPIPAFHFKSINTSNIADLQELDLNRRRPEFVTMTTQEPHVTVTRTTQPISPTKKSTASLVPQVPPPTSPPSTLQARPRTSTSLNRPSPLTTSSPKSLRSMSRGKSRRRKSTILKMPKMSPMELIRWLSLLGLGVATMSAGIWGVPRLWNWTRSTVPTLWGGGKSYKPEYKQHYNVHENDRYSRSPAGAPHWQSASPFSEALGSLDNFANSFLWPYNTPSTRPGATIPGEGPAYFPPSLYSGGLPPGGPPPGLRDYGNHYSMSLAMPGLAENDVMVRFSEAGARLRVDAHARTMDRKTGRRGELLEVAVVTVPRDAEVDRAVAEMTNGMLTLTIPKKALLVHLLFLSCLRFRSVLYIHWPLLVIPLLQHMS
ncbi:hypothetical protein BC829DRAFT_45750 [Chytridium lagenaria]|nr:hypothetical protein BC829DRAFT_45750 [Chytridium lagenaria]